MPRFRRVKVRPWWDPLRRSDVGVQHIGSQGGALCGSPNPREVAPLTMEATPECLEATATSGPSDLLCRIVARDTEHLQEIVNRLLSNNAIRRSTSYIALSQPIAYRTAPLVDVAWRA